MADPIDIVTLAEAKAFLNISGTTFDTELPDYITAASSMWIKRGGPGASSPEYDEWHDGGGTTIALRHVPVLAISALTEATGSTLDALTEQDPGTSAGNYGYSVDTTTGAVTRRAGGIAVPFAAGKRNVHVVYTAGFVTAPADVKHAILLLILHMWETQRGGTKKSNTNADDYQPGTTYSWPRRVEEIFMAYSIPGIA